MVGVRRFNEVCCLVIHWLVLLKNCLDFGEMSDIMSIFSFVCTKEETFHPATLFTRFIFTRSIVLGRGCGGLQHQHPDRGLHRHLEWQSCHHPGHTAQGYALHYTLQVSFRFATEILRWFLGRALLRFYNMFLCREPVSNIHYMRPWFSI